MDQEYLYKAFISYSHKDKLYAKWIQKRIEDFKVPKYIIKESNIKEEKVGHIFRDQTDLSGYKLDQALKYALEKSEYLIVLCTSNSAKSKWVNQEIEYFIKLGKEDKIIPVLKKHLLKKDKNQIPQALLQLYKNKKNKFLYWNYLRTGIMDNADLLKIVNILRNSDANFMLNKYKDKHSVITITKSILVGVIITFIVIRIGYSFWLFHGKYTSIYWNETMVVHGKDKRFFLSESDEYYQLIPYGHYSPFTNNDFTFKIIHNFSNNERIIPGQYLWDDDTILLSYDMRYINGIEGIRISKEILKDSDGNVRLVKNYALTDSIIDLSLNDNSATPCYLPNDYTLTDWPEKYESDIENSPVCRIAEVYNDDQQLTRIWFLSGTDSYMIPDVHGYYGLEYIRNSKGVITSVNYLDEDGTVLNSEIINYGDNIQ